VKRTVLVTGANRGIGLAIAKAFHANGDEVFATYRSEKPDLPFHWRQLEVSDSAAVTALFEEIESNFSPVEILVSNAGITRDNLILRMSVEDFDNVLTANLKGSFLVAQRAAKGMLKIKKGSMIFIGSVVGQTGSAGQTNYSASKAALVGLTRSLARELGSRSIRANVIAPGFIDTDMTSNLTEQRKVEIAEQIPLKNLGTPEDVAQTALFLASDSSRYITGAIIPVDGGLGMGH
jgi:3-oxoacyl-[acyl-carrier protein] reductase